MSHDAALAVRNTFKLGSALVVTWTIGLAVRILLPRVLGPEQFGQVDFADAFTTATFVAVGLGLDTYIRKEVSVRTSHASEFLGGTLLLQFAMTVLVFAGLALAMHLMRRPQVVQRLVYVFGAAQAVMYLNGNLGALLHAKGSVHGLSVTNVAAKIAWVAGLALGLLGGAGAISVPIAMLMSEIGKAVVLFRLARRHLGIELRVDLRATKAVVLASLPFHVSVIASTIYARVDTSALTMLVGDMREVGWYGAGATLARLGLLLAPMLGWVAMPLFARAAARSEAELYQVVSRAVELLVVVATPISLMLALGADVWVPVVFGKAYAPAILTLRLIAPVFVATYVASVAATVLCLLDKGWTVTRISIGGMILNPVLISILVPRLARIGPLGTSGAACALSVLLSEILVTALLASALRWRVLDGKGLQIVARTALACALVVAADRLVPAPPLARVVLDGVLYSVLAIALGAVRWREMYQFVQSARRQTANVPA